MEEENKLYDENIMYLPRTIFHDKIDLDKLVCPDKILITHGEIALNKIQESIKENGWIPNFQHLSYHGDSAQYAHPFIVNENYNNLGTFKLSNALHRYEVLRRLGYEYVSGFMKIYSHKPKCSEEEIKQTVELIRIELQRNQKGMFQSFEFDYNLKLECRDKSKRIFESTTWHTPYWIGKKVLDIACNGGYFAFEAKRWGADKVVAFDHDDYMIEKAIQFKKLLDFEVDLSVRNFWDFDWSQKFDIVFCNQCIYHFGNNKRAMDALDVVCNTTTNNLVMFTFVNPKIKDIKSDLSTGYRPGHAQIWHDLKQRGFKEILIFHDEGGKRTVVASKQPWKYLHFDNRSPKLEYYNDTLKENPNLQKWFSKTDEELISLWQ